MLYVYGDIPSHGGSRFCTCWWRGNMPWMYTTYCLNCLNCLISRVEKGLTRGWFIICHGSFLCWWEKAVHLGPWGEQSFKILRELLSSRSKKNNTENIRLRTIWSFFCIIFLVSSLLQSHCVECVLRPFSCISSNLLIVRRTKSIFDEIIKAPYLFPRIRRSGWNDKSFCATAGSPFGF